MQHPYVYPCQRADVIVEKNTLAVIRPAYGRGSLKNLVYKTKDWRLACSKKYRSSGTPLPEKQIATFGRQILEGLAFLEKKHVPYLDLHSGNIMYNIHVEQ